MTAFEYSKVCGPWQNFVGKTWTDEDNLHWWLLYEIKWLAGQEGHVLLFHVNLSNVLESYLPSTCPEFSKLFWVVGSLWLEVTSLSHWLMLLATSCHVALQNALWKLPAGHYVAWFALWYLFVGWNNLKGGFRLFLILSLSFLVTVSLGFAEG